MNEFLKIKDQIQSFLTEISSERNVRNECINGELGWVTYERHQMFNLVNDLRCRAGKKSIDLLEIKKVEDLATGHVDYASKFSLYCAELVLDN